MLGARAAQLLAQNQQKLNVLFIATDDLNALLGCSVSRGEEPTYRSSRRERRSARRVQKALTAVSSVLSHVRLPAHRPPRMFPTGRLICLLSERVGIRRVRSQALWRLQLRHYSACVELELSGPPWEHGGVLRHTIVNSRRYRRGDVRGVQGSVLEVTSLKEAQSRLVDQLKIFEKVHDSVIQG